MKKTVNGTGIKPGIKTTEFWIAILAQAVPLFVLFGWMTPTEGEAFTLSLTNAIVAAVAMITALAPLIQYINGRAKVKAASILSSAAAEFQASNEH